MAHSRLVNVEGLTDLSAVMATASVGSSTRTVYGIVIALGLIGLGFVVLAMWLIRQTRPERQLLAPLERMDDRSWRDQEPTAMRRDLDSLRPTGARPVIREQVTAEPVSEIGTPEDTLVDDATPETDKPDGADGADGVDDDTGDLEIDDFGISSTVVPTAD